MPDPNKKTNYPIIGELALKHSLIKKQELNEAVAACTCEKNIDDALGRYLVSKKLISDIDMKRLNTAAKAMMMRHKDIRFGVIAINLGLINKSLVEMALDEQKKEITINKKARHIGDILVEAGIISSAQKDLILKEQNRLQKENEKIKDHVINEILNKKEKTTKNQIQDTTKKKIESYEKISKQIKAKSNKPEGKTDLEDQKDINLNFARTKKFPMGLKLIIPENGLAAYLIKTDNFDQNTKIQDILDILEKEKITFGIVDYTLIRGFIKSKTFQERPFRIAKGLEPEQGKDAVIKYFFDTDRLKLKPGEIDKDGKIDFKDRGDVPYVVKGAKLAEKIPMVKGKDGKNIFSKIIPARPGADAKLKYDKGALFSDNGTKLIASIDGHPKLSWAGVVSVLDEFIARQDVDYETGHINYKGDIRIRGCVKNGFKVKGNSISANEIDGGIIYADGNLTVTGIISKARIYSRGNIRAKFIHNSKILCLGDIHIEKEIVESKIENSGACIIKKGKIINSSITSKLGVYVKDIDTEMSMASSITTGIDIFILKETKNLENKIYNQKININASEKEKAGLEEKNRKNQDKITIIAQIQDKAILEIKNIATKIASLDKKDETRKILELKDRLNKLKRTAADAEKKLNMYFEKTDIQDKKIARLNIAIALQEDKLKEFMTEKENLTAWGRETPGIAMIKSNGTIMAGTIVAGKYSKKIIKNNIKNATIKEIMANRAQEKRQAETNKHTGEKEEPLSWEIQVITGA